MNIIKFNDCNYTEADAHSFIMDNVISMENDGDDKVVEFYYSIMNERKRIPTLYEIVERVVHFNDDILYEAVDKVVDSEGVSPDKIDDRMAEIASYISHNTSFENPVDTPTFVESVLYTRKLSFIINGDSDIYYEKDISRVGSFVIANDSQHVLFESVIFNSCAGYGSFINYYNVELEELINPNQLLLPGGDSRWTLWLKGSALS